MIAPRIWDSWKGASTAAHDNVLYLPIATKDPILSIKIEDNGEQFVDLSTVNNPRILHMSFFDKLCTLDYDGYANVREGVYSRLLAMLDYLPGDIGIAYFEGFRPIMKQKEYFNKKMREMVDITRDPIVAYEETCKLVSPFLDNVPPHSTGAAIDMTLFQIFITAPQTAEGHRKGAVGEKCELLDMGMFDVIFGPNNQQEMFSPNTTLDQRCNRMLLLEAAAKAGFVNYAFEWWHYSYGDKAWAHVTGKPTALYGVGQLPGNALDPDCQLMSKEQYIESFQSDRRH